MEVIQEMIEPSTHEVLGSATANPPDERTGYPLPALGKIYHVASLENRIIAQFELWAEGEVLKGIHALSKINQEEADMQRSVFHSDKLAGHYKWDVFTTGKHIMALRLSTRGTLYLLYLLMRRCDPKITEEEVKKIAVDNAPGMLDALRWAQGNWQRREGTSLGLMNQATDGETETMTTNAVQ